MEELKLRYKTVVQALTKLEHMIKKHENAIKTPNFEEDDIEAYRDSVIKRFEFCYDLTWKLLKGYLELQYGLEVASPKKTFQACLDQKILKTEELELSINMVEDRNMTCHIYNESMAEEIVSRMPVYYNLMQKAVNNIQINNL